MRNYLKKKTQFFTKTYDILAIPVAWYVAYWLRDNMNFLSNALLKEQSYNIFYALIVIQLVCYKYFKVSRGLWRFSSINDVQRIIRAVLTAVFSLVLISYITQDMIPRSILPLYALILVTFLCGGRLSVRLISDRKNSFIKVRNVKKVLVIGAGQAAEGLLRELKRSVDYIPVGIVDDSFAKHGTDIHGVRVLGGIDKIVEICEELQVDLIIIAIASANSKLMRRLVYYCEMAKVPFQTLPSLQFINSCKVNLESLRQVSLADLLGRDQVAIDWQKISDSFDNKVVLVTGGGGSIGSELCRQIAKLKPAKLIILDNNEYNLYAIDAEFAEKFPDIKRIISLVSVTDMVGVEEVFYLHRPNIVFHAAAYKHVPLLEDQVRIAVYNNIIGTKFVAEISVKYDVEKFILISTDKAVNPTNIMGSTKRIAEIFCQNLNEKVSTKFITVRFGNVLGSTGSVVPLFQQQLLSGGPLTVTHPDMQRYFMTIPEATELILQAMINGNGGEIFVLDMGDPVKISYLAEQIIRLAGLEPGKDIKIKYTGLRPGEKLFEELFHPAEMLEETKHKKLFQARFREINWEKLMSVMQHLEIACIEHDNIEILKSIKTLVPEYDIKNVNEFKHAFKVSDVVEIS